MEEDPAVRSPVNQVHLATVQLQLDESGFSRALGERLVPLSDPRLKDSDMLRQVHLLWFELQSRAQRPAFATHVDIHPSDELKKEDCSICREELGTNITNKYWRDSHATVITSCGHIFGGNCLWTGSRILRAAHALIAARISIKFLKIAI
jgi:hypothetical protein